MIARIPINQKMIMSKEKRIAGFRRRQNSMNSAFRILLFDGEPPLEYTPDANIVLQPTLRRADGNKYAPYRAFSLRKFWYKHSM
jgi:hypothetical protein